MSQEYFSYTSFSCVRIRHTRSIYIRHSSSILGWNLKHGSSTGQLEDD